MSIEDLSWKRGIYKLAKNKNGNYKDKEMENSLENILIKILNHLEKEKVLKKLGEITGVDCESLDKF